MTTISTRALPAGIGGFPRPSLPRRSVVAAVATLVVTLGGFGLMTSAVKLPDLSAVHLEMAAPALARAAVDWHAGDARGMGRSALQERASCWRQAHRLGHDPSSCGSTAGR